MQKQKSVIIIGLLVIILGAIPFIVNAQQGQNRNQNGSQSGYICGNCGQQQNRRGGMQTNRQNQKAQTDNCLQSQAMYDAVDGELSDDVVMAMIDGIMDEYNAYNTYQSVINQFGEIRPFTNIQRAEAQHINAWEVLFERYGVDLPEQPAIDNSLTFDSVQAACEAAVEAEVTNFSLYDDMLDAFVDYPDMMRVVTNLRDASEFNHLPAFERCAQ